MKPLAALLLLALPAIAQDAHPQFEVASIKPAAPDERGMTIRPLGRGGIDARNESLKDLIMFAYRVMPFQISGATGWMESARYDILAKPGSPASMDQLRFMVQALLADRFQMKIHRETKDLPVYALLLARKDGKLGPSLRAATDRDCTPFDPNKPAVPLKPGSQPVCGSIRMSLHELRSVSMPVASLLPTLSRLVGRIVVDKTGLTGNYDTTMNFTLDEGQTAAITPPGVPPPAILDDQNPSLFTALEEQLGLKLESQKGPVEVLVIDHASKPSAN